MTKADKPIRRETYTSYRGRPLIIEIHSTFVVVRAKGRRKGYSVTLDQIWNIGARNAATADRLAKLEAKKARKRGEDA